MLLKENDYIIGTFKEKFSVENYVFDSLHLILVMITYLIVDSKQIQKYAV